MIFSRNCAFVHLISLTLILVHKSLFHLFLFIFIIYFRFFSFFFLKVRMQLKKKPTVHSFICASPLSTLGKIQSDVDALFRSYSWWYLTMRNKLIEFKRIFFVNNFVTRFIFYEKKWFFASVCGLCHKIWSNPLQLIGQKKIKVKLQIYFHCVVRSNIRK